MFASILKSNRSPRCRWGFTLAELMIAIMILAVGLTMAAAVFPAAMEFASTSVADGKGAVACENALAMVNMIMRYDLTTRNLTVLDPTHGPGKRGESLSAVLSHLTRPGGALDDIYDHTAIADAAAEREMDFAFAPGAVCRVFARQVETNANDFQFVVVAVREDIAEGAPGDDPPDRYDDWKTASSIDIDSKPLVVDGQTMPDRKVYRLVNGPQDFYDELRPGTPVIRASDGLYAYVDAVDAANRVATLRGELPEENNQTLWYVDIHENAVYAGPPILGACVIRTGLPSCSLP
jgi:prepilin-type N-terminal cleavage/methylation domain-containing protein